MCPLGAEMDTSREAAAGVVTSERETGSTAKRERRSVEEKRRIVEETLVEGVSGSRCSSFPVSVAIPLSTLPLPVAVHILRVGI